MIKEEILNTKCEKCGKQAIGYVKTVLLCGECIIKWHQNQQKIIKAEVLGDI